MERKRALTRVAAGAVALAGTIVAFATLPHVLGDDPDRRAGITIPNATEEPEVVIARLPRRPAPPVGAGFEPPQPVPATTPAPGEGEAPELVAVGASAPTAARRPRASSRPPRAVPTPPAPTPAPAAPPAAPAPAPAPAVPAVTPPVVAAGPVAAPMAAKPRRARKPKAQPADAGKGANAAKAAKPAAQAAHEARAAAEQEQAARKAEQAERKEEKAADKAEREDEKPGKG